MSFYSADGARREATIRGLRELADFLDANHNVPAPQRVDLQLSTYGETMADRIDTVDEFAELAGASPAWFDDAKTHYMATRSFGAVQFFCIAIDRDADL